MCDCCCYGISQRNAEYAGGAIVIDPDYYKSHAVSRGDIIYFKVPNNSKLKKPEYNLARIIALSGPFMVEDILGKVLGYPKA